MIGAYKLPANKKALKIIPQLDETLPPVPVDILEIHQALESILENAVRYTPEDGSIILRSAQQDGEVIIDVQDTGIGIARENLEVIFEKFYRGESAMLHSSGKTSFKGGGPGLGLAIARGIVEAHRGRLWAESEEHDEERLPGSTFHILLPVRQ